MHFSNLSFYDSELKHVPQDKHLTEDLQITTLHLLWSTLVRIFIVSLFILWFWTFFFIMDCSCITVHQLSFLEKKMFVCFFILHPKVSNAARWNKAAMVNNSDVFPYSYIFPLETENLTGSCRGDLFQQKPIPHLHQIKS